MYFPDYRPRRLRKTENLRRMIRETDLTVNDLIYPFFIVPGQGIKTPIGSMPGQYHLSVDKLVEETALVRDLGIPAVLLFGLPETKDEIGSSGFDDDGIVQRGIRAIKEKVSGIEVITDVCLCEYTSHGHCGLLRDGEVDNDATLDFLARQALSHVRAGADMVAPSDMMDGRVSEIRQALDENEFQHIPIMSYAAKFASAFYGPFREAAQSAPSFGDRRGISDGSGQRPRSLEGSGPGRGGRGGHRHGQAGPAFSGYHPAGPGQVRPAGGCVQRQR